MIEGFEGNSAWNTVNVRFLTVCILCFLNETNAAYLLWPAAKGRVMNLEDILPEDTTDHKQAKF
jgi:hypothetical protein